MLPSATLPFCRRTSVALSHSPTAPTSLSAITPHHEDSRRPDATDHSTRVWELSPGPILYYAFLHFFGTFLTSTVLSSTHFHFMVVTDSMTSIDLVIQSHVLVLHIKS